MEKAKRILVVDDDPVLIKLVGSSLKKEGYDVTTAIEAADGLQIAMDQKPDLVVLDVMMPVINGYNFCRLLKAEQGKHGSAIIFLTSRNKKSDINIGMEMGADAYLTKPVNTQELLAEVSRLLTKSDS